MTKLNSNYQMCKCVKCRNYSEGNCPQHKDIKIWIKPNTNLFNYNVDFRGCFVNK